MTTPSGFVELVGAGPGDPGLITVRGRAAVQQAEVLIYDQLVHPSLLDLVRPEAERIFAGKRAGRLVYTQDEINQLLVEKARQGKRVVRLKGLCLALRPRLGFLVTPSYPSRIGRQPRPWPW